MSVIFAFLTITIILAVGDLVSVKSKAMIPSVFVASVIFLIGFWTKIPANILELSGIGKDLIYLFFYLLLVHMGTLISISELVSQWKTIIISLVGIVGICLGTLTIGAVLFGWKAAIIATPPLSGGVIAVEMMKEVAIAKGMDEYAIIAIVVFILQGFFGYPITSIMLKKEGNSLLSRFRKGEFEKTASSINSKTSKEKKTLIPQLPEKYQTSSVLFAKLALVSWLGILFTGLINESISRYIILLLFGIVAAEIGFLERQPLIKSKSIGFVLLVIMANIYSGLNQTTPQMLMKIILPVVGLIIVGICGMALLSIIVGRFFGYSKEMSFCIALTALYGFPANYILTEEAANAIAQNEEEKVFIMDQILPKMLVAGVSTVTVGSVILAGIFINFI